MTSLAILLIIISLSKLLLSIIIHEDDIYPSISLPISYQKYVFLIRNLLFFDGFIGLICGLYIL
jgi:hypothetical protein